MSSDAGFRPISRSPGYRLSDDCSDSIFVLSRDLRVIDINPAYRRFAVDNGLTGTACDAGRPLDSPKSVTPDYVYGCGRNILDVIPGVLKQFYQRGWSNALEWGRVFESDYECSSSALSRKFRQTAYPLADGSGLVVTNHCLVELPCTEPASDFDRRYLNQHQFVVQCCNCRRIRNFDASDKWDWVPALVDRPHPMTSHGMCSHCLEHYYPGVDD